MKAICQGNNTYDIFDDTLVVYDQLPAQSYVVRFSSKSGFFLEKYVDMDTHEEKVYGIHVDKVRKVLRSFASSNRSLGVILSGDKGIGKSLFAKMLSIQAINEGMPVIVVDRYYKGIAPYIENIDQECMVLFDEFDKTFGEVEPEQGDAKPQTELLTLFDGLSGGKRLFVVTCNSVRKLNEYLVNRPGRFHYHFRFDYPSTEEIREYLHDKLNEKYYGEIDSVIAFAMRINLNYDCLRAIAFELNSGEKFADAIRDLNIVNIDAESYRLKLRFENGIVLVSRDTQIDMFGGQDIASVAMYNNNGDYCGHINFHPENAVYDGGYGTYIVKPENMKMEYYEDEDDEEYTQFLKSMIASKPVCMQVCRPQIRSIHYAV